MSIKILKMVNSDGSDKFKPRKKSSPMSDISFLIHDDAPSMQYTVTLRCKGYTWDPENSPSKLVTLLPNNYVFVTINATLIKDGELPDGPNDDVTVTVTNQQSRGTTTTTTPIVITQGALQGTLGDLHA